jgi:hypothetical protein
MGVGRIISLTEYNTGKTKKFPCAVNTMIELQNISNTSENTAILLSENVPCQMPVLSEVFDTFFSTISVLTPNGQFLDCATVALSERYCHRWLVRLYHIFPHDLINSTIFGEKKSY